MGRDAEIWRQSKLSIPLKKKSPMTTVYLTIFPFIFLLGHLPHPL